jgi:formylmethanofuran dehydrogenase subunit E
METVDQYLEECERLHGHMCPGQVLGVRMAMLGCELVGIAHPKGADRKKLIVWVEIDRCMTDAVSAVTGARLGRRSLKFQDYGKVAATFHNLETDLAVRVVALDEARALADTRNPHLSGKKERQLKTYLEAPVTDLFKVEKVKVNFTEFDAPGHPRSRVTCSKCGEGINDARETHDAQGRPICIPCSGRSYFQRIVEP